MLNKKIMTDIFSKTDIFHCKLKTSWGWAVPSIYMLQILGYFKGPGDQAKKSVKLTFEIFYIIWINIPHRNWEKVENPCSFHWKRWLPGSSYSYSSKCPWINRVSYNSSTPSLTGWKRYTIPFNHILIYFSEKYNHS